jgi:hypothetical protein
MILDVYALGSTNSSAQRLFAHVFWIHCAMCFTQAHTCISAVVITETTPLVWMVQQKGVALFCAFTSCSIRPLLLGDFPPLSIVKGRGIQPALGGCDRCYLSIFWP